MAHGAGWDQYRFSTGTGDGSRNEGQRSPDRASSVLPLDRSLMVPALQSQDRMGAIKELVDCMHRAGCVTDSLSFLQSVLDREDLESTVLGTGVAFPHTRCRSVPRLGVAFGISREGVDFYSEYCPHPVHLICLLAVPVCEAEGYLPLLGRLTGLFQDSQFRSGLVDCHTPEEMYRFLSRSRVEEKRDGVPNAAD